MSHLHRTDPRPVDHEESQPASRSAIADVAGRFANWITGADVLDDTPADTEYGRVRDPMRELSAGTETEEPAAPRAAGDRPRVTADRPRVTADRPRVTADRPRASAGRLRPIAPAADADADGPSRFPVAPLGYNRAAVDEHLAALEREVAELQVHRQPSIAEELERLGEQTASILVVAHDQANETTRLAREQAERCVADAAANAVAITAQAKERLRELDTETDAVWRERERLLEDVRGVSASLASLADRAQERFPADPTVAEPPATPDAQAGSEPHATAEPQAAAEPHAAAEPPATIEPQAAAEPAATIEPQATQPFSAVELEEAGRAPGRWEAYDVSPPFAGNGQPYDVDEADGPGLSEAAAPEETDEFPQPTDSRISGEFPGGWDPRGGPLS